MSFYEPRLKPLPSTFFYEGDVSPVRSKVLRRSVSYPGYIAYKQLNVEESSQNEDLIFQISWLATDDELELDSPEDETAESDTWTVNTKPFHMQNQQPEVQPVLSAPIPKEAHPKVQPCGGLGRDQQTLDDRSFLPPERVLPFPNCVPHSANGFEMPNRFNVQHQMLSQPQMHQDMPASNHEAPLPRPRGPARRSFDVKQQSKHPGLQERQATGAASTDHPKLPPQVDQAMKAGARAIDKARELNAQRALNEQRNGRAMMPAVNMKPRHAQNHDGPWGGKASGRGRK